VANIFYLHWHADEAADHVKPLKAAGHRVRVHSNVEKTADFGPTPSDAFVISLDRLPSHGRAVAAVLWESKKRRSIPVIFVGGATDKIKATKTMFPAATYCRRDELLDVLKGLEAGALAVPVEATLKKPSTSGYSGKPLPQKMGLIAGQRVAFLHPPKEWDDLIGPMPADVTRFAKPAKDLDLAVLFVTERRTLAKEFPKLTAHMAAKGMIWVSWPKKSAKVKTDLDENVVREIGLDENWVDVKVCAVSEVWSGLKFLRRKKR
jgi:hypothetical protein